MDKVAKQTKASAALSLEFQPAGSRTSLEPQSKEILANVMDSFERGYIKVDNTKYKKKVGNHIDAAPIATRINRETLKQVSTHQATTINVGVTFPAAAQRRQPKLIVEQQKEALDALNPNLVPTTA